MAMSKFGSKCTYCTEICEMLSIMPKHCYLAAPSEEPAGAGGTINMSSRSKLD